MSDWLDSMEFVYLVASYFPSGTALDSKDWIERVKLFRAVIRSHFVPKPQWTKIADPSEIADMPSELENVLVMIDLNSIPVVAFWSGVKWRETYSEDELDWPIAWMPLPEPYRGEE